MMRVEMGKWNQTGRLASGLVGRPQPAPRTLPGAVPDRLGDLQRHTWRHIGRHDETVLDWVHRYNEHGPDALSYRRTVVTPPFCPTTGPAAR